jgi:hypothetical protein
MLEGVGGYTNPPGVKGVPGGISSPAAPGVGGPQVKYEWDGNADQLPPPPVVPRLSEAIAGDMSGVDGLKELGVRAEKDMDGRCTLESRRLSGQATSVALDAGVGFEMLWAVDEVLRRKEIGLDLRGLLPSSSGVAGDVADVGGIELELMSPGKLARGLKPAPRVNTSVLKRLPVDAEGVKVSLCAVG